MPPARDESSAATTRGLRRAAPARARHRRRSPTVRVRHSNSLQLRARRLRRLRRLASVHQRAPRRLRAVRRGIVRPLQYAVLRRQRLNSGRDVSQTGSRYPCCRVAARAQAPGRRLGGIPSHQAAPSRVCPCVRAPDGQAPRLDQRGAASQGWEAFSLSVRARAPLLGAVFLPAGLQRPISEVWLHVIVRLLVVMSRGLSLLGWQSWYWRYLWHRRYWSYSSYSSCTSCTCGKMWNEVLG